MPKPNKSSATSNTRKKQASKKAGGDEGEAKGKQKFERYPAVKGLTKAQRKALKENRPKVYIPPPRPPVPARPDPLDAQGLARTLPAELVVVLRRLGKKDAVTKRKGIDELKDIWVDVVVNLHTEGAEDPTGELTVKEDALTEALPVWVCVLGAFLSDKKLIPCTARSYITYLLYYSRPRIERCHYSCIRSYSKSQVSNQAY